MWHRRIEINKAINLFLKILHLFTIDYFQPLVKTAAPQVSVAGALTNLFGVEAGGGGAGGAGARVDWHAGDKRQKKLSAMEPSDSDGLGGTSPLPLEPPPTTVD